MSEYIVPGLLFLSMCVSTWAAVIVDGRSRRRLVAEMEKLDAAREKNFQAHAEANAEILRALESIGHYAWMAEGRAKGHWR